MALQQKIVPLLDVFPREPLADMSNGRCGHAPQWRFLSAAPARRPYRSHIVIGQSRVVMLGPVGCAERVDCERVSPSVRQPSLPDRVLHVVRACADKDVAWPDAVAHVAVVAGVHSVWNRAVFEFKKNPMHTEEAARTAGEHGSIPTAFRPPPQPTGVGLVDF